MEALNIKAGQPINFIGEISKQPRVLRAGTSRANPVSKVIIYKGTKLPTFGVTGI